MSVDAAYALETFQQDLVNVPEEVAHYLEEMKFKDVKLNTLRRRIQHYDNSIQKHIRQHGSLSENPKEAINNPKIVTDYEQAIKLQEEKCELAHKLNGLVTRHLKRLDSEIKKLQNDGALAPSTEPIVLPNIQSLQQQQAVSSSSAAHHAQAQAHAHAQAQHMAAQQAAANQAAAAHAAATHAGFLNAQKRASPHAIQQMAAARSAAMGDAVGVNGAVGPDGVRGVYGPGKGSMMGDNGMMRPTKRHKIASVRSTPGPGSPMPMGAGHVGGMPGRAVDSTDYSTIVVASGDKQSVADIIANQIRNSGMLPRGMPNGVSNGGDKDMKNKNGMRQQMKNKHSQEPEEEDDEENNDSALYCFCQQVSYGDMVACDNEDCRYEWFHYGCVGLKSPPSGVWYCSQECQEKTQNNKRNRK
ncbi:inhibitor of growth proteins N-terminal histone-binding-domain-containing protein [Myxozyma melibiosi]|uniref:Chromatin modification-related protein YNG2 n=1 Tax=Myxozyma melibiosi TaxID=54550 RepID=A0ABR1F9D7_9ASCO